jgi:hypothetical protein
MSSQQYWRQIETNRDVAQEFMETPWICCYCWGPGQGQQCNTQDCRTQRAMWICNSQACTENYRGLNYNSRPDCSHCSEAREVPEQQEAMAANQPAVELIAPMAANQPTIKLVAPVAANQPTIKLVAPVAANPPTIKLVAPVAANPTTIKLRNLFDVLANSE